MNAPATPVRAWRRYQGIGLALVVAACAFVFRNEGDQGLNWTFPYLSGAANFDRLFDWRISPSEYDKVEAMTEVQHRSYRYVATAETIPNTVQEYGYVLVALTARNLFPWLGDIQALSLLQGLLHVGISMFILLHLLESRFQRAAFFVLYAVNPLVLRITTLPYYYFWTVLPSVALAVVLLKKNGGRAWVPALTAALLLSLAIRPTTLFVMPLVFAAAFWLRKDVRSRVVVAVSALAFAVGVAAIFKQGFQRSAFHTIYIGIGAYANPYGLARLDDQVGFDAYREISGENISTHAIHGNWRDPALRKRYNEAIKERYLEILRQSPFLLARNAALNTVQAFGVGYDVDRPWSRPLTVAIGAAVIGLLLVGGQWIWCLAILAYAAGFSPYFPPVPAYLFGAYLMITLGVSAALERVIRRRPRGRLPGWARLKPSGSRDSRAGKVREEIIQ